MAETLKDKEDMEISQKLLKAYKTAKEAPGHKSVLENPQEYVFVIVQPVMQKKKKTKEEIEAAIKKIEASVEKNEKILKQKKLTVKEVLKTLPKIRAEYNKEHYGIDTTPDD